MTTRKYSSRSQQTTLTAGVTSTATTLSVVSGSALLGGVTIAAGETFTVVLDPDTAIEEIVDVTAVSSNTLTVTRGIDGSSGQEHSAGAVVRHMAIGRDYREANSHIENTTTAHGITLANLVKTTDTGTVSSAMIASGAVGTAKIDDAAITEAKIGTSAVTAGKIATDAVTTAKIQDSAVTSAKIADGTIVNADINASAAIDKTKISGTAITAGDTGTVTSTMIADGTIVNADINASAAIDKTKISGTAITAGDTGTVTSTMIADGTIVNADINSSAQIAYGKLNLTNSIANADIATSAGIELSKLATDPLARANHTGTQAASTISDFDTQVRTSKLNQMAAPAADVSMATYKITNLGTPSSSTDAATKSYVDTSINNLIDGAPSTLDTLNEIAAALNDTANFSDTVVLKAGSTMSGNLAMGTNKVTGLGTPTSSTDAATKGYVDTAAIAPSNLTGPITSVGPATSVASQTGTGSTFVMQASPTLTTPDIGVATATSINGTTIPSSKTLVATDSTAYVVPSQTGNSGKYLTTDGTTSSWSAVAGALAQPTEPSSPQDGLVWVDTDGTIAGTAVTRWSKTLSGSTSSLSGNDDNSLPLSYVIGNEQVFLNGALLSRGNDYTATSGTTITLTTAGVSGDIVEVIASAAVSIVDTYTQTQTDAKYVANTIVDAKGDLLTATASDTPARLAAGSNGQVLTVDSTTSTGLKWASSGVSWTGRSGMQLGYNQANAFADNGSGTYVAVFNGGYLASSTDSGVTWTNRTSGFGSSDINAVTYGNGVFVAVGINGLISSSSDGITWTARTSGVSTNSLYAVSYGNSLFVAVGAGANGGTGGITTSSDGTTWTKRTTPTVSSTELYDVNYADGYWITVGPQNTRSGYYSSDGATWTVLPASASVLDGDYIFHNGTYHIIIIRNSLSFYYASTPSGTWTAGAIPIAVGVNNSYIVKYSNYIYLLRTPATYMTSISKVSLIINTSPLTSMVSADPVIIGPAGSGTALYVNSTGGIMLGTSQGIIYTSF